MRPAIVALLLMLTTSAIASEQQYDSLLLSAYIRLCTTQTTEQRIHALGKDTSAMNASQLSTVASQWKQERISEIRTDLVKAYGESAPQVFSEFVAGYTDAESKNDAAYLAELSARISPEQKITGYSQLREQIAKDSLREFSDVCIKLMGNIEAWIELAQKDTVVPPLHIWLSRDKQEGKQKPVNRLRNAEAVADIDPAVLEKKTESVLAQFEAANEKRNKSKLDRAKASMAQLATERKQYEDAYAQKMLSAAKADAEGMKRQARKIADAEKEAIKQHENSWGMKFKRIIGATVGATADVFFGGIGARAGAEAADLIF